MERIVFLDRDGTLNDEVCYLHRPEDLRILPGVPKALRMLKKAGYRLVVVTNQAGVARGYYTEEDVKLLHHYMNEILEKDGAGIDAFYYCPHHPEHGIGIYKKACHCRKPDIGMFEMAASQFPVDRAHSFMIGDKILDVEAGKRFGLTSILVGTGYGESEKNRILGQTECLGTPGVSEASGASKDPGAPEARRTGKLPWDFYAADLMEAVGWIIQKGQSGHERNGISG